MSRSIPRYPFVLLALALAAVVATPRPAEAALSSYTGKVVHIADGDTFDVQVGGKTQRIRMLGLNTMEIGECNAGSAAIALANLIDGRTVTLKYKYYNSMSSRGTDRYLRHVYVDGYNVAVRMIRAGYALGYPNKIENTYNSWYLRAMQETIAERDAPLWDNDHCGVGPSQSTPLKMWVRWDADGNDGENINGETIRILNRGSTSLNIGGWQVRDTALNRYRLPSGTSIPAKRFLTIHVGSGTNNSYHIYLGKGSPMFENDGDAAFLLDPDGDIRASFTYPCMSSCGDSMRSKVNITADPISSSGPNGEWVKIKNISSSTIDLTGYLVQVRTLQYDITRRTTLSNRLAAGEYMRIRIGKGDETRRARYWGRSTTLLPDSGDKVRLKSWRDIRIDCYDWGSANC